MVKVKRKRYSPKRYREIFNQLIDRDGNQCAHCGSVKSLTIDHVKPIGIGSENIQNLQILCRRCNSKKGREFEYDGSGEFAYTEEGIEGMISQMYVDARKEQEALAVHFLSPHCYRPSFERLLRREWISKKLRRAKHQLNSSSFYLVDYL